MISRALIKSESLSKGENKCAEYVPQEGSCKGEKMETTDSQGEGGGNSHFEKIYNDSWYDISGLKKENDIFLFCAKGNNNSNNNNSSSNNNSFIIGTNKKYNKNNTKKKPTVLKTVTNGNNENSLNDSIIKALEKMYINNIGKKQNYIDNNSICSTQNLHFTHDMSSRARRGRKFASLGKNYVISKGCNEKNVLTNFRKCSAKKEMNLSFYKQDLGKIKENLNDIKKRSQRNKEMINHLMQYKNMNSENIYKELGLIDRKNKNMSKGDMNHLSLLSGSYGNYGNDGNGGHLENNNDNHDESVKRNEENKTFFRNLLQNNECDLLRTSNCQTVTDETRNILDYSVYTNREGTHEGRTEKHNERNNTFFNETKYNAEKRANSLRREMMHGQTSGNNIMDIKYDNILEQNNHSLPLRNLGHTTDGLLQNHTHGKNRAVFSQLEKTFVNSDIDNNYDKKSNILDESNINNAYNVNVSLGDNIKLLPKDYDMMFTIDFKFYKPWLIKNITQIQIYNNNAQNKMLKNIFIDSYPQQFSLVVQHKFKIKSESSFQKMKNKLLNTRDTYVLKIVLLSNEREVGFSVIPVKNLLSLGKDSGMFLSVHSSVTAVSRLDRHFQIGETKGKERGKVKKKDVDNEKDTEKEKDEENENERNKDRDKDKENCKEKDKEKNKESEMKIERNREDSGGENKQHTSKEKRSTIVGTVSNSDIFPFNRQELNMYAPKIFVQYKLNCPKFLFDTMPQHDIIKAKDKITGLEHLIRELYTFFENSFPNNSLKNIPKTKFINEEIRISKKKKENEPFDVNTVKESRVDEIQARKKDFPAEADYPKKQVIEKKENAEDYYKTQHEKMKDKSQEKKQQIHVEKGEEKQFVKDTQIGCILKKIKSNIKCNENDTKENFKNGETGTNTDINTDTYTNTDTEVERGEEETSFFQCSESFEDKNEEKGDNLRKIEWHEKRGSIISINSRNVPLNKNSNNNHDLEKTVKELHKIVADCQLEIEKKKKEIDKLKHAYNNLNILYKNQKKAAGNNSLNGTLDDFMYLPSKEKTKRKSQQQLQQQKVENKETCNVTGPNLKKICKVLNNRKSHIYRRVTFRGDSNRPKCVAKEHTNPIYKTQIKAGAFSKSLDVKMPNKLKMGTKRGEEQAKEKEGYINSKKSSVKSSGEFPNFYKVRRRNVRRGVLIRKSLGCVTGKHISTVTHGVNVVKEEYVKEPIPDSELEQLQNEIKILKTEINELKKHDDEYLNTISSLKKNNILNAGELKENVVDKNLEIEKCCEALEIDSEMKTSVAERKCTNNVHVQERIPLQRKKRFDLPCYLIQETCNDNLSDND